MLITLLKSYLTEKFRYFKSRKTLEAWQDKQVQKHIKKMMEKSPYYRNLYAGLDLSCWRTFPIISKKEMMENFSTLNTCGIALEKAYKIALDAEVKKEGTSTIGNITIGLSSGTSGHRGVFLVNPEERFKWAGKVLAKMLPKWLFRKQKIAFFFRLTSPLYTTIRSKVIEFEYYNLEDVISKHVEKLNYQKPDVLVAAASMLRKLSDEALIGRLKISPMKIISISEVLDPVDETYISKVFGQKIHQIYQATEGFLAATCKCGTLHLNEDSLVIEKEPIFPGSSKFHPIITDFYRETQPIIRYRLNDILEELDLPCPCGSIFTAIKSVEGRSDDIFYFLSEENLKPIFPDFIRRAILSADSNIQEYLAVQLSPKKLKISLKTAPQDEASAKEAVERQLMCLFEQFKVEAPEILFSPYEEPEAAKKLRRIERRF